MDFCELTEFLWKCYLSNRNEENQKIFDWIDSDCVIIGTGAHEFYIGLKTFLTAWFREAEERKNIEFQVKSFWCEEKELSPQSHLVYGNISIWWESEDKSIYIDMNTRFSIIYQKINDDWKIVHMHQSIPNIEQMDGEYFPRTLYNQIESTQKIVEQMTHLALRDGLTNLVNYRGLEDLWTAQEKSHCWLFIIDLDDFKKINDTYGHIAGNDVLKKVADILTRVVRTTDVVCRMGGDEFIVLCGKIQEESEAHLIVQRMLDSFKQSNQLHSPQIGISIGGTHAKDNETLEAAIHRADQALYNVKKSTKNSYCFI